MEKPSNRDNRREFIKKILTAGAGVLLSGGLAEAEEGSPEDILRDKNERESATNELFNNIELAPNIGENFSEKVDYWYNKHMEGGNHRALKDGWQRMSLDLVKLIKIFKKEEVPLDIIFLAQVESYWKKDAISHIGAYGYWQFMPETAKEYGLMNKLDMSNVEKSTRAACKYLKYLYRCAEMDAKSLGKEISKSDLWTWAFWAYNHGQGNVFSVGGKTGHFFDSDGDPNNYFKFCRSEEATNYAPKIFGVARALKEILFKNNEAVKLEK